MKRWWAVLCVWMVGVCAEEPELWCEKKWGELTWEGIRFERYRLKAEHFPPEQKFRLVVKSFDGTSTDTFTYLSNKKGHLIFQPEEPIDGDVFAICPLKRGERLTLLMRAEKGDVSYGTDFIPFPLEFKSKSGVVLHLELQGEKGEKFLLFIEGLKSKEEIILSYGFEEKTIPVDIQVTPLGEVATVIAFPAESQGGEAKILLKRKREEILFPFVWGAPALELVGACCLELH